MLPRAPPGFPIRFTQVAIGCPRDQAVGQYIDLLHFLKQRREIDRRSGEVFAHDGEGSTLLRLRGDHVQDDAAQERFGFFIPVRFSRFARWVIDQGIGKRCHIVGNVQAGHVQRVQRVVGVGVLGHDVERVEDAHLAKP